jgi:hypothetical protein
MTKFGLKNSRNKWMRASTPPNLTNYCAWGSNCKINFKTSSDLYWSDKLSESNLIAILTILTGIDSGIAVAR